VKNKHEPSWDSQEYDADGEELSKFSFIEHGSDSKTAKLSPKHISLQIRVSLEVKNLLDLYRGARSYNHFVEYLLKDYLILESLKLHIKENITRRYNTSFNPFDYVDYGFDREQRKLVDK